MGKYFFSVVDNLFANMSAIFRIRETFFVALKTIKINWKEEVKYPHVRHVCVCVPAFMRLTPFFNSRTHSELIFFRIDFQLGLPKTPSVIVITNEKLECLRCYNLTVSRRQVDDKISPWKFEDNVIAFVQN